MKEIWILVANRAVAKVYSSHSFRGELELVRTITNPCLLEEEKAPQEREADAFARHLALVLDRERCRGRFDELVLVAEPGFLGRLRAQFGKRPAGLSRVRTVNKELTHFSARDLRLHLSDVLFELWQDPRGSGSRPQAQLNIG